MNTLKLSAGTLISLATLGLAIPGQAQETDPQAKAILAKSAERYKKLTTWHVEEEVVNAGRFSRKITADFQAPKNLVVRTNEAKGIKTVAYYDSQNVSTVRDFDGALEYQVTPLTGTGGENPRTSFNALGPHLSGFFSGEENVFGRQTVQAIKYVGAAIVNGAPVDNVAVTASKRGQTVTTTYSIGKNDSLLHKVVQSTPNADGTTTDYVETYTNQKTEAGLPAAEFQFSPPAGAKKVDRFTQSRGLQVNVGDAPFAIKTKDLQGKELALDQYKGKVVLLDFWATWCPPCRAELPNLKAAYAKYNDQGFDVIGISLDQTIEPLVPFVAKEALSWRHIYDGYWNGPVAKAYNVRFIPSTVLIGRDGKVAAINARGEQLNPAIEAALKSN